MRRSFASALGLLIVGAAAVLLVGGRSWQTLTAPRPRPFADLVVGVTGRRLDGGPTALDLVALAGAVAVLATRGWGRRVVGVLVALAGAGAAVRSLQGLHAVGAGRAAELVGDRVDGASAGAITVRVSTVWPVLSGVAAAAVVLAGCVVAVRGGSWAAMSARYETPQSAEAAQPAEPAPAQWWNALDRGEDPTTGAGGL